MTNNYQWLDKFQFIGFVELGYILRRQARDEGRFTRFFEACEPTLTVRLRHNRRGLCRRALPPLAAERLRESVLPCGKEKLLI